MEKPADGEEKKKHFRKKTDKPLILPKSTADKQRLQIEKLMRNPDKPVYVPEKKKEWSPRAPAEFVRDVMGSSAGAGSGEFHVYRGYRRRELARVTYIQNRAEKEDKDVTYHEKLEQNEKAAEERTAKKRAKRQKQKQKMKAKKKKMEEEEKAKKKAEAGEDASDDSDEDEDEKDDDQGDDAEENCFVIGGR
ncbi:PRKR-interacting protein 1 homolog [Diadema antillarum]|uniref:PRKR-interacting protein 1 homolog n=1 Tax=Diadema antillarum TaxID=105358 RepID=UPI003A85C7CD